MESPAKPGFLSDSSPRIEKSESLETQGAGHLSFPLGPRNRPAVWKVLISAVRREMMEHPDMRHPEFGLLCPPPRLLRELRIAFTFLLIGGVAGALCASGILGLRHAETASLAEHGSLESTVGSNAPAPPNSQDHTELGRPPNSESSAAKPEPAAPGAAPSLSAVAPKARVVRIRRPGESPVIARLPLGRTQSPTPVSAPDDTPLGSTRDLGALCGAGRVNRGPVPDTGHPIRCKRATVQCWTAEEGAEDEVALRTIVATRPGMIIRGVIILPIIGARAERPRMTSDVARRAAHMRARVPIP